MGDAAKDNRPPRSVTLPRLASPFHSRARAFLTFAALSHFLPVRRLIFLLCSLLFTAAATHAQPLLPDLVGVTQKGVNILAWTAQYDGLKSIAVQRSSDSVYNFTTIGYVKNLKKGPQGFIDGHPNPGNNWYRLYIAFSSDLTWYSNRFKLRVDSASIANKGVIPPNDSLQKMVKNAAAALANVRVDSSGKTIGKIPDAGLPDAADVAIETYIRSQYVFTNPFTGHVNVEVPNAKTTAYSIRFYDAGERTVLDIPRVPESPVVIDKRNFQKKGLYRFELYRDRAKWESGYVTVY